MRPLPCEPTPEFGEGDESEQHYLKILPTSFTLSDEQVDRLRDAAHRILSDSQEFQQFLRDLK